MKKYRFGVVQDYKGGLSLTFTITVQRFLCCYWQNMCGDGSSMTWWYVTPSERYSSHLMMLILFEHSPQRGLGKSIYLLILFSTLLAGYISSLLFQIVLLLKKMTNFFLFRFMNVYIYFVTCEFAINFLPILYKISTFATKYYMISFTKFQQLIYLFWAHKLKITNTYAAYIKYRT